MDCLACRTGGLAGSSAMLVRAREARAEKNPPVITPLFVLYRPLEMIDMD